MGELFYYLTAYESAGAMCLSGHHRSVALIEVVASWASILLPQGSEICVHHHGASGPEAGHAAAMQ